MKINFTPLSLYGKCYTPNKIVFKGLDNYMSDVSYDMCDRFEHEDDYAPNLYQYAELADHETKFRNLPKSHQDKLREMSFVDYIAGYDEPDDGDDFLEKLTY